MTNRIAELERELAAKLLRRDTRNVARTEQGKALCEYARRIVEMTQAMLDEEYRDSDVLYPSQEYLNTCTPFINLDQPSLELYDSEWLRLGMASSGN